MLLSDVDSSNLSERDGSDTDAEHIRQSLSQLHLASPLLGAGDSNTPVNMADTKGNPDTSAAPALPLDVGETSDVLVAMSVTPGGLYQRVSHIQFVSVEMLVKRC